MTPWIFFFSFWNKDFFLQQTHKEWQRVFFLSAAIYVIGALVYLVLSSGEIQDWAKGKVDEESVELKDKTTDEKAKEAGEK